MTAFRISESVVKRANKKLKRQGAFARSENFANEIVVNYRVVNTPKKLIITKEQVKKAFAQSLLENAAKKVQLYILSPCRWEK